MTSLACALSLLSLFLSFFLSFFLSLFIFFLFLSFFLSFFLSRVMHNFRCYLVGLPWGYLFIYLTVYLRKHNTTQAHHPVFIHEGAGCKQYLADGHHPREEPYAQPYPEHSVDKETTDKAHYCTRPLTEGIESHVLRLRKVKVTKNITFQSGRVVETEVVPCERR